MTLHNQINLDNYGINLSRASMPRHFAGRLIFDHLPKTAGQAINSWPRSSLGEGCVTDNLNGRHRELIGTYGGNFSVVSGHIDFDPAEGLDPRYQYATLLREPVDRVISWLFFVLKNHDEDQLGDLFWQSQRFVETDGAVLGSQLKGSISNLYTHHFSRILGSEEDDPDHCISNSLAALRGYDVVGVYEDLPRFTNDLGALIGITAPPRLEPINVTFSRPGVDQISARLRNRIIALNQLDLKLYAAVQSMVRKRVPSKAPANSVWTPLQSHSPRFKTSSEMTVHNAEMLTSHQVREGEVMTFAVDFELHCEIAVLEAGIHIFDEQQRWAFGVNSSLLDHHHVNMKPGRYRVLHHVVARLPAGKFTAGFAFADVASKPTRELFWHDALVQFVVTKTDRHPGVGYSICPSRQTLWPTSRLGPGNSMAEEHALVIKH